MKRISAMAGAVLLIFTGVAAAQQPEPPVVGTPYFNGIWDMLRIGRVEVGQAPGRRDAQTRINSLSITCPGDLSTGRVLDGDAALILHGAKTASEWFSQLARPAGEAVETFVNEFGHRMTIDMTHQPNSKSHLFYIDPQGQAHLYNDPQIRAQLLRDVRQGRLQLDGVSVQGMRGVLERFGPLAQKICFATS